jgi:hypothetical protein
MLAEDPFTAVVPGAASTTQASGMSRIGLAPEIEKADELSEQLRRHAYPLLYLPRRSARSGWRRSTARPRSDAPRLVLN